MKRVHLIFIAFLIPFFTSCATSVKWTHSSANEEQTLTDIRECRKLAKEKFGPADGDGALGGIGAKQYQGTKGVYRLRQKEEQTKCMESKGYVKKDV